MQCDANTTRLSAYLDGELSPEQAAEIREHLSHCPGCASEIAELARLQRSLRSARTQFAPSADFRSRIRKQIAVPQRRPWWQRLVPAAVAVLAILLVAFSWINYSRRADDLAEMADLHVNLLASANPVDVVSTDRHTVKPWFQGKIPFSFNLPDLAGTDFTLLGGRMAYFHQAPGAQLVVSLRQHRISVLIFQESPDLERAFAGFSGVQHRNSFGLDTWQSHDLRFLLISDAGPAALDQLAELIKQANP